MERLLCIVGGMNAGGAETFMMKLFRQANKEKYIIDFAVAINCKAFYDDEIISLGGKIYHIVPKTKGVFKFIKSIFHIVKDNGYQKVLRISQNSVSVLELIIAKMAGAKYIGLRSSNSNACGGFFEKLGHIVFKPLAITVPNIKIAPSKEAAVFMFGKRCFKKGKVTIMNNGIDLNTYEYSLKNRLDVRNELNISKNDFVVGHIGRFNYQKNHIFLIKVFKKIHELCNSSKLLLVGKGEKEEDIKKMVTLYGLENCVIFAGVRNDISRILSAIDSFVLPSLFEGMPNTVIEAQASGLNCVISDTITRDVNITGLVDFLSLSVDIDTWANHILESKTIGTRSQLKSCFIKNGYDIASVERRFSEIMNLFSNEKKEYDNQKD